MLTKKFTRTLIPTVVILLIPLIAMQFNSGVNWSPLDFVVAGVLLISAGLIYELIVTKLKGNKRLITLAVLLTAFILLWIHLAVGIVNSWPLAGS